ncbi:hypothetical protein LJ655_09165 [Paraburkholderia sp. MMS20-SJTN17]|uniref:Uncharacterized protein n=1 Tax=Paraburkholderia translucens TaxID=2886945 RepID=A0ABS8KBG3_9BURK|nr:hypothetical protein [Paraburkholderia sp. MMS20-SJTN17]MCC8402058.1 hypothetical protein [Paraburkholderia sp. MMS20-SJTN17]
MSALRESLGDELIQRVDPACRTEKISGWFHTLVESVTWDVPLGRHLLLSYFIFEDAEQFLAEYQRMLLEASHPVRLRQRSESEGQAEIAPKIDLFQTVLEAAKQMEVKTLDALWQAHYGIMKRLLKRDAEALPKLEKALRRLSSKIKPGSATRRANAKPDDDVWAEKLKSVTTEFYQSEARPVRASRSQLLQLAGWRHKSIVNTDAYPELSAELEKSVESAWHFYIRRVLWARRQPLAGTWSADELRNQSGVEWHRCKELVQFCAAREVTATKHPASIMETLADWGIDRQWLGPCPGRIFPMRGRAGKNRLRL